MSAYCSYFGENAAYCLYVYDRFSLYVLIVTV